MIYALLATAFFAFAVGTVMFYRFSKAKERSTLSPFASMCFFDALFFGLGNKRDMNIAACSFMVFLLSMWWITYLKLRPHFWGSPESYFGLGIAGIFFLIMHCRFGAKNIVIKNDGLAPMRELINIRRSGLTSPFLWLSRAGYLGWLIGIVR
ncbi:hypothetical protein [Cedecea davisae]|uniref:hypothetical protein n=1 Tax=Cedecea davisae TaxID=158484 RepID=UPI00242A3CD8|nr:hypothetical protein [Cedecea davisae]